MNIESILSFEAGAVEDYYEILGCDPSSTEEQIMTEFKIRAKEFHPDKCSDGLQVENEEKFKFLLEAKNTLTNPDLRKQYDAWRSAGLAIKFQQWLSLKDSVKTSMHWATPKTSGRMLEAANLLSSQRENEPVSLRTSPITDKDMLIGFANENDDNADEISKDDDDDVTYPPVPYNQLGLRLDTPPPELEVTSKPPKQLPEIRKPKLESMKSVTDDSKINHRRKLFAIRRESTIGTMVMAERLSDSEIRRRFRDYEI